MGDRERQLRQRAYKVIQWQILVALIATIIAGLLSGAQAAGSIFSGCVVCILANYYFARKLFSIKGRDVAKKFIKSFYRGEIRKILLTILLTFIAIRFLHASFLPFIIGYSVTYLVFMFSPLIINSGDMVNEC